MAQPTTGKPHEAQGAAIASDLHPGLSKPAQRALAAAGYARLEQFTQVREAEVLGLHGMEPKAMDLLRRALAAKARAFADGAPGGR